MCYIFIIGNNIGMSPWLNLLTWVRIALYLLGCWREMLSRSLGQVMPLTHFSWACHLFSQLCGWVFTDPCTFFFLIPFITWKIAGGCQWNGLWWRNRAKKPITLLWWHLLSFVSIWHWSVAYLAIHIKYYVKLCRNWLTMEKPLWLRSSREFWATLVTWP